MLSNYRPGSSLSVSAGVSGSYNHPAGVAKAIKGEVKKKHVSIGWNFSCFAAHLNERDLFYKRRSQEKTRLHRLEFFLLRSPLERARSVLTCRARCSVAGQCDPVVWVFSTSGFHRFLATKPVSSETNKAERGQI